MQSNVYVALSAQRSLQRRLDTLAHNVANTTTAGYRAEQVSFASIVSPVTSDPVSFVSSGKDFVSTRAGGMVRTGAALDVAIAGDAWFAIETPSGTAYTRDGRFTMDAEGGLVTTNGYKVLDAGGAPIQLDPAGERVGIGADGAISQSGRSVGSLGLFLLAPEANLARHDNSAVVPDRPAIPQLDFSRVRVAQGFYEQSNVDPVREMTRLIAVQRTFDAVSNTISDIEGTMSEAIRSLGS